MSEKETKENKKVVKAKKQEKSKENKHKEKATIGDLVFRTLILVIIFFIACIGYVFFIDSHIQETQAPVDNSTNSIINN